MGILAISYIVAAYLYVTVVMSTERASCERIRGLKSRSPPIQRRLTGSGTWPLRVHRVPDGVWKARHSRRLFPVATRQALGNELLKLLASWIGFVTPLVPARGAVAIGHFQGHHAAAQAHQATQRAL